MRTQCGPKSELQESARYFPVPGAHLYTVLHPATDPVARVLLVGAFASERQFAYHTWVRWARFLAARNIEVLRYDYRGIGESTGNFGELNFEDWSEDVRLLAGWFADRSPRVPLLLHGLEMGALLAGRNFHKGIGDALLLWSPPTSANQVLRSTLQRWSGLEQLYESPGDRKSAAQYVRLLEQGSPIEVQGYRWSSHLWRESFQLALPNCLLDQATVGTMFDRPVRVMKFGRSESSLAMPYVRFSETESLTPLYTETYQWLAGALAGEPVR